MIKNFTLFTFFLLLMPAFVYSQTFTVEQNTTGNSSNIIRGQSFTPSVQGSGTGSTGATNTVLLKSVAVVYSSGTPASTMYLYSALPTNVANLDAGTGGVLIASSISRTTSSIYSVYNFDNISLDKTQTYYVVFRENVNLEFGISSYSGGQLVRNSSGAFEMLTSSDLKMAITFSIPSAGEFVFRNSTNEVVLSGGMEAIGIVNLYSPVKRVYTIENTGTGQLAISSVKTTGNGISISAAPANTVAAGSSTTFEVTYNSTTEETVNGKITIVNDDADESTFELNLYIVFFNPLEKPVLTAVAYSDKQINLVWDDRTREHDHYSLERSTSAGSGFSEISQPGKSVRSYNDTSVVTGTTYFYRIRSLDKDGHPSSFSDVVQATGSEIAAGDWQQKKDFPAGYRGNPVSFVVGGKAYIGTGTGTGYTTTKEFWQYNEVEDTWISKADLPGAGRRGAVSFVINDKAYVGTGIAYDANSNNIFFNDFYSYDATADVWTKIADCPISRLFAVAFSVNGKGYVGGGTDGTSFQSDFYEYNPATNTWRPVAAFPGGGIASAPTFVLNNLGFVVFNNNLYSFDSNTGATGTWTRKGDLLSNAKAGGCFVINGVPYVVTGNDARKTQVYNVNTDNWEYRTSFGGSANSEGSCFALNGKGYYTMGRSSYPSTQVWVFNPFSPKIQIINASVSRMGTTHKVTLSWTPNSNSATGYIIERGEDIRGPFTKLADVSANQTSYEDSTLVGGNGYYYSVITKFPQGESDRAMVSVFTAYPNNVKVSYSNKNNSVSWTTSNTFHKYIVERKTSGLTNATTTGFIPIDTVTQAQTIDLNVQTDVALVYRIRGVDFLGKFSAYSDTVQNVVISAPTVPAASSEVSGVLLSWEDNAAAKSKYVIQRAGSNLVYASIDTVSGNIRSYKDINVVPSSGYNYRIAALLNNYASEFVDFPAVTTPDVMEGITGLEHPTLQGVEVYPNPAADYLVIESKEGAVLKSKIDFISSDGKTLNLLPVIGEGSIRYDLQSLPRGLYTILIKGIPVRMIKL